jgi:hypothetical protein
MLVAMYQPVDWWNAFRAYYVGHIGKYSPGKALVPIIRASLIKASGPDPVVAFVAVAYETVVFMAAGTAIGSSVCLFAFNESFWAQIPGGLSWLRDWSIPFAMLIIALTFASTPVVSWLFTKIGHRIIVRRFPNHSQLPAISVSLISQGIALTAIGWCFHALSLGFVIAAVTDGRFDLMRFPMWLTACALSTVGGFIAIFAPGGLGVREGLLIEVLKDQCEIGPALAVVVACTLRFVWFLTELIVAAILFPAGKCKNS